MPLVKKRNFEVKSLDTGYIFFDDNKKANKYFYHNSQRIKPIVNCRKIEFLDINFSIKNLETSIIAIPNDVISERLKANDIYITNFSYLSENCYGYKNRYLSIDSLLDILLFPKKKIHKEKEDYYTYICDLIIYIKEYYCPICNNKISFVYNNDRIEHILSDKYYEKNILSTYLYNDENKIASGSFFHDFLYKAKKEDNKIIHKSYFSSYKNKIVFNKKTLSMYYIENLKRKGSTFLVKSNPKKIKNITFCTHKSKAIYEKEFFDFYEEVYNYLVKNYEKDLNYIFNDIKFIIQHANFELDYKFYNIINQNTYSIYNFDLLYKILYMKKRYNIKNTGLALYCSYLRKIRPDIMSKIKHLNDNDKLKKLKITNKEINNIVLSIDERYFSLHFLVFGQIKDINNIKKIINKKMFFNYNEHLYKETLSHLKSFLKKYKKGKNETTFVNSLVKYSDYLVDTAFLYQELKNNDNYFINFNLTIKQIHDQLSKDFSRLKRKNKRIPKNKNLKKIFSNYKFKNIKYSLAKDIDELINVGNSMNICVGSYGEKAVNKNCYIVIGYDNDIPVTCIELNKKSDENFEIIQVKKSYNKLATLDEQTELIKLFKINNIKYFCNDLKEGIRNIKSQEIKNAC